MDEYELQLVKAKELLESTSHEDLKEFVSSVLKSDYKFRKLFIANCNPKFSKGEIDSYIEGLKNDLKIDYHRYSRREINDAEDNVEFILGNVIPNCINRCQFEEALLLINTMYDEMMRVKHSLVTLHYSEIVLAYEQLIKCGIENINNVILNKLLGELETVFHDSTYIHDNVVRNIEYLLDTYFMSKDELIEKLNCYNALLEDALINKRASITIEKIVMDLINISEQLEKNAEVNSLIEEYSFLFRVCEYNVKQLCKENKYEKAIEIAKEFKSNTTENKVRIQISKLLCDIYDSINEADESQAELLELLRMPNVYDDESFIRLESCYSESQWEEVREEIIASFKCGYAREGYYCLDGMGNELYEIALNSIYIDKTIKYHKFIKDINPLPMLEKYKLEILEVAKQSGKSNYQIVCNYIKNMQEYPGGVEYTQSLIKYLEETYKRRTTLMYMLEEYKI